MRAETGAERALSRPLGASARDGRSPPGGRLQFAPLQPRRDAGCTRPRGSPRPTAMPRPAAAAPAAATRSELSRVPATAARPRPGPAGPRRRHGLHGQSIGATGTTIGEVVFNTALTGYQEILTDPSYCRQIVTLTYPHIGNYGVNAEDVESRAGLRRRPGHQGPAAAARRTSAAAQTLAAVPASARARSASPTSTRAG